MRHLSLGVLVVVAACGRGRTIDSAASPSGPTIAIVNATAIPMDTERMIRAATIIVRGDRIVWVGPSAAARIPDGAQRVDARGAFVLPGLADLHVHTAERHMPLYLQNGVTTIRELNGSPELLALRARIRSGTLQGPTMHVAGTLLAGTKQPWRHRLITTPDEGRAAVREQAAAGYEFIKVYEGLSVESYGAIVAEAARLGVRVIGHVPVAVGVAGVLAARQTEIEHIEQIIRFFYRDSTAWRARVDSLAAAIAAAGTWVNPTLAVEEGLSRTGTRWYAAQLQRPDMRFVDSSTMAWWSSLSRPRSADSSHSAAPVSSDDDYPSPRARAIVEAKRATVVSLRAHGVRLLMGSDLPNPLMVAGFAIHEELSALVRAGLTPFEAITTATRSAGEFMGGDRFGVLAPGTRADLIIVSGNPLEDVTRLREPSSVMVRGSWAWVR